MTEAWQPVSGYEGLYAISDLGRVRSTRNGKVLSPVLDGYGYQTVRLYRAGKDTRVFIHRLVAAAFCGASSVLHWQVAHLDGDKTNNRAPNLKWVSAPENAYHKRQHGTHQAGERHPRATLTKAEVEELRRRAAAGARTFELARYFGVSWAHAKRIVLGQRWKDEHAVAAKRTGAQPQQRDLS
jgi:NUMOD4 motif/HNH endonuclease